VNSTARVPLLLCTCAVAVLAGCSSDPEQVPPKAGELTAGSAQITVNGNNLGQVHSVTCTPAGALTTMTTGSDSSGSTVVVSNADGLTAKSVSITDLGGFTGSFNEGLGGKADVTLSGATYSITGQADGFRTDKPSYRTTGTFTIKIAC